MGGCDRACRRAGMAIVPFNQSVYQMTGTRRPGLSSPSPCGREGRGERSAPVSALTSTRIGLALASG